MDRDGGIPARVLAPAALVVCAVLFFFVLLSSGGGGEGQQSERARGAGERQSAPSRGRRRQGRRTSAGTYTVKAGDTLGGIAEKTGVSVEELQELNPQLDPQALVSGQRLRLR